MAAGGGAAPSSRGCRGGFPQAASPRPARSPWSSPAPRPVCSPQPSRPPRGEVVRLRLRVAWAELKGDGEWLSPVSGPSGQTALGILRNPALEAAAAAAG